MYVVVESCLPCLNFYMYKAVENKIPIPTEECNGMVKDEEIG
jgi:hypothetical protein